MMSQLPVENVRNKQQLQLSPLHLRLRLLCLRAYTQCFPLTSLLLPQLYRRLVSPISNLHCLQVNRHSTHPLSSLHFLQSCRLQRLPYRVVYQLLSRPCLHLFRQVLSTSNFVRSLYTNCLIRPPLKIVCIFCWLPVNSCPTAGRQQANYLLCMPWNCTDSALSYWGKQVQKVVQHLMVSWITTFRSHDKCVCRGLVEKTYIVPT